VTITRNKPTTPRRCLGKIDPSLICVLLLLVFALAAVAYLVFDEKDDTDDDLITPGEVEGQQAPPNPQIVEARLDALRQEFNTIIDEKLDATALEARVRVYTERHPENAGGFLLLGQARMSLLRWADAYEALSTSLQLKSDEPECHRLAGACAAELGRYDQAQQHYLDALRIAGPRANCALYRNLGQLYLVRGDLDAAEQAYTRSLDAPAPPGEDTNWKHEGYAGLANVASQRGDLNTALQNIELAIVLSKAQTGSDEVGYYIQKARIYADAGQDEQAITTLVTTARNYRNADLRIEAVRLRARLYERAGNVGSAVEYINTILELRELANNDTDAELAEFYALLAQWQIHAGQNIQALNTLDVLRGLSPDHPQLEVLRAQLP